MWDHDGGADERAFQRDSAECRIFARQEMDRTAVVAPRSPLYGATLVRASELAFDDCMYSKGWFKVEE